MAKTTAVTKTVTKEAFVNIASNTDHSNPNDVAELLAAAKGLSPDEFKTETGQYKSLEDGETYLFVYNGIQEGAMRDMKDENKLVDAVMLTDEKGDECINADVVMLATAKRWQARGLTPPFIIRVFVNGMAGAKGREYKNLEIARLKN